MPFNSPQKKRDYQRELMRRRRAKLPKKVRVYPPPKPKSKVVTVVLCSHCGARIPYEEWAKSPHTPG